MHFLLDEHTVLAELNCQAAFNLLSGGFMMTTEEKILDSQQIALPLPDSIGITQSSGLDRHAVAYSMTTGCYGVVSEEQTATLMARDFKDAPLVTQPVKPCGFFPQMKAEGMGLTEEKSATLVNGTNPGYHNGVIDQSYIVRRLTPTECARLQGFPDWWRDGLGTEEPTEDEIAFWTEVWETHRRIVGTSEKPKSRKQVIKCLRHPHSDAAEYK